MRKNVVCVLLSIAFLFLLLPAPSAQADGFDLDSLYERYVILVDASDPTTALCGIEKNADVQCATGSTIKILTCMLAIESGRLDEVATISDAAVNFNKYNSLMGLKAGEQWTIRDLLYGLMLPSGNDAAVAIAETLAGSTSAFVRQMNAKAQELGMTHSHFVTVHGKDNKEHYSTARDMAILTAWALQNKTFQQIVSTTAYTCTDTSGSHTITLRNTNRLLIDAVDETNTFTPISCLYPDAIGVKTGDTDAAGKCFIAAASRGGLTLIAVLLGGTLDDADYLARSKNMNAKTKDPYNAQRFQDAIKLFDFGFKQMSQLLTIQDLIDMGMPVSFSVQVQNAAKNDPDNGLLTVSPRLDPTQQLQLMKPFLEQLTGSISTMAETRIGTLVAPINARDVVGTVEYKVGNSVLFSSNLYADRDVKEGILSSEPTVGSQQPQVSAGAPLMGTASTLTGEPVKETNVRKIIMIVLIVLFALVLIAFVVFLIVVRIRQERRRKAKAAARRRKKLQQERIARQRAAELDRQK